MLCPNKVIGILRKTVEPHDTEDAPLNADSSRRHWVTARGKGEPWPVHWTAPHGCDGALSAARFELKLWMDAWIETEADKVIRNTVIA